MNKQNEMLAQLKAYSQEICGSTGYDNLTLSDLIDSHRRIRSDNQKMHKEQINAWQEAREKGFQFGITSAKEQMISVEKLSQMSMLEIAAFISKHKDLDDE